ncbi:MAG: iron-sulfur cluster assembly accessory protein [Deltaproteobacteria bacterium]|nr:MAG: iron-sulfur cluster assembly accessory protein [Deltaproteobacteria bacterium]
MSLDFTVTDAALEQLEKALRLEEKTDHLIRIAALRMGARRLRYSMDIVPPDDRAEDDLVLEVGSVTLLFDPESARLLEGARVDFVDRGLAGSGFKFDNPLESRGWDDPVAQRLQDLLDREINPQIASHGGIIELLDFKEGRAFIRMGGGCQGCGMASATLREGVEARVKEAIPEVLELVDTTDHAAGQNPYYRG